MVVLAASLLVLAGCDDGKSSGGTAIKQGSPQDVLLTMHEAAKINDLECCYVDLCDPAKREPFKTLLSCRIDLAKAYSSLADTIEKKFDTAESASTLRKMVDGLKTQPSPLEKVVVKGKPDMSKVKVEIRGDKAWATIASGGNPLEMKKISGKWCLSISYTEQESVEDMTKRANETRKEMDATLISLGELDGKIKAGKIAKERLFAEIRKVMGTITKTGF